MGEIAEAILNGDMTEDGEWIGADLGHPINCLPKEDKAKVLKKYTYKEPIAKNKVECELCGKRVRKKGLSDHLRMKHGLTPLSV